MLIFPVFLVFHDSSNQTFIYFITLFMYKKNLCKTATLKKMKKNGFPDRLSLNAGQKYCRMLQREHSAILSTFTKLPVVIKIFVLSIFEWLFYTGFTIDRGLCGETWHINRRLI